MKELNEKPKVWVYEDHPIPLSWEEVLSDYPLKFTEIISNFPNLEFNIWDLKHNLLGYYKETYGIYLSPKIFENKNGNEYYVTVKKELQKKGIEVEKYPLWYTVLLHELAHYLTERRKMLKSNLQYYKKQLEHPLYRIKTRRRKNSKRRIKIHKKEFIRELVKLYKLFPLEGNNDKLWKKYNKKENKQ